jgi:ribosomal protein S18 acetylase RimI-like enzyme
VLAVLPEFRNLGLGSVLLEKADEIGASLGKAGMSVIVADNNRGARKLYERFQFKECAQRPMVKEGWVSDNENWVLLTKQF